MGGQCWNGIEYGQFGIRTGVQRLQVEEEWKEGGRLCVCKGGGEREGDNGLGREEDSGVSQPKWVQPWPEHQRPPEVMAAVLRHGA